MKHQNNMINRCLSQEEKAVIIREHLENLIEKEKMKPASEMYFDRFKKIWNSFRYSRLAIGIGISVGVTVSALSGSYAIAGGLLLSRAVLGSVGGFMATEAIFELINSRFRKDGLEKILDQSSRFESKTDLEMAVGQLMQEMIVQSKDEICNEFKKAQDKIKTKKRVKMILGATGALVMGVVGGSRVIETVSAMPTGIKTITTGISSKINGILDSATTGKKVDSSMIKDIFTDIRQDHPTQRYVTLEQAERRIEGLKAGIGLDESEKLNHMNSLTAKAIRGSDSGVIRAMKDLGYMEEPTSFETCASRLSEGKITEILIKAHENDLIDASAKAMDNSPDNLTAPVATDLNTDPPKLNPEAGSRSWTVKMIIGAAAAIGIGAGGKRLYDRFVPDVVPKINFSSKENPLPSYPKEEKRTRTSKGNTTYPQTTSSPEKKPQAINATRESDNIRSGILNDISGKGFGFRFEKTVEIEGGRMSVYTKQTVGGHFAMIIKSYNDYISADLIWYDHGAKKKQLKDSFLIEMDSEDHEGFGKMTYRMMYGLLREMMIKRDMTKCLEVSRHWHTVEISKHDLSLIYVQADHPEILRRGAETGGFWYQNSYEFHNGTLKMRNLQNPNIDEMDIRNMSFSIRGEDDILFEWNVSKFIKARESQFDAFESKIMGDILRDGIRKNGQWSMSGCSFPYNWHKHPGNLYYPRQGDLSSSSSACIVDMRNHLNQMTYSWGILNHLPPNINETNNPENSIILRGKDFGGTNDYIIYFWRVNRNGRNRYGFDDLIALRALVDL